jgi:PAS domain-containing protein
LGKDGFGWLDVVHPDDREESGRVFLEANKKREPFTLDYRLRRADGAYRWAIDAGRPRFDEAGAFLGYVGLVIDITERRENEVALRESESRFRQLAKSLPQLVWTCRADGPCDYLSPQWVAYTGIPEDEQLGFGWLQHFTPTTTSRLLRPGNRRRRKIGLSRSSSASAAMTVCTAGSRLGLWR